ncbi:DUF4249 domain-containing protein [Chryseotalea sanaruensis]|nr:DUF4249 domain-containing protein [Chryseotalea sanaruensis]
MKKYIQIPHLIVILFCYTGCETEIDFPINHLPPTIVVNGLLETDSVFKVHLSTSAKVTGNIEHKVLETAAVKIKDEDGQLFDLELVEYNDNSSSKFYKSTGDYKPIPGKQYFIEASNTGIPSISATLTMPEVVELSNVKFASDQFQVFERNQENNPEYPNAFFLPVRLTINDQPGENYYELSVLEEHLPLSYINQQGELVNSPGFFLPVTVFSYNTFLNSSDIENWEGLDGVDYYRRGELLFSDEPFDGKALDVEILAFTTVRLNGFPEPLIEHVSNRRFHVVLNHVSKEYYTYRQTLRNYLENRHNNFVEPINVYSNIKNGLGIFLGNTSHKVALDPNNQEHY